MFGPMDNIYASRMFSHPMSREESRDEQPKTASEPLLAALMRTPAFQMANKPMGPATGTSPAVDSIANRHRELLAKQGATQERARAPIAPPVKASPAPPLQKSVDPMQMYKMGGSAADLLFPDDTAGYLRFPGSPDGFDFGNLWR